MTTPAYIERQRQRLRRPIRQEEVPYLERLAAELRALRNAAGLSRGELGARSDTSASMIRDIERTTARTRMTTLERLSRALAETQPRIGPPKRLLTRLTVAAGPALAPESEYAAQVEKRRRRWARKGRFGAPNERRSRFERPKAGESPAEFLSRMAKREEAAYVCLHCGRAAIGLQPED